MGKGPPGASLVAQMVKKSACNGGDLGLILARHMIFCRITWGGEEKETGHMGYDLIAQLSVKPLVWD